MGAGREQRWYGAPGDWGYQLGFRQGGCSIFKLDNDGSLMKSFFFFFFNKGGLVFEGLHTKKHYRPEKGGQEERAVAVPRIIGQSSPALTLSNTRGERAPEKEWGGSPSMGKGVSINPSGHWNCKLH